MRIAKLVVMLCGFVMPASAQTDWELVKTFPIGGPGGWDYLTVDPQTHRLYVPRSTHTMVIDAGTGKTIADIPGQKNAHGVALAPEAGRGFISDAAVVVHGIPRSEIASYCWRNSSPTHP